MTSSQVKFLQAFLNANGASLDVDGVWGLHTEDALEAYITAHSPTPIPAPTTQLRGIDVYHGDNVLNWAAVLKDGFSFVFIKASQGLRPDPKFSTYFPQAKAAGLIAGPYHFMDFSKDGVEQAQEFFDAINLGGGLKDGDLPPVCDWEYADGRTPVAYDIKTVAAFLAKIQSLTGRIPMIYLSEYLIPYLGSNNIPRWIAKYSKVAPQSEHIFWQYAEDATIGGVGNPGDANLFNGDMNDLKAFIASTKV